MASDDNFMAAIHEIDALFDLLKDSLRREKERVEEQDAEIARLKLAIVCRGDDPGCPCHDGDPCHYRGDNPMKTPAELEVERLKAELENVKDILRQERDEKYGLELEIARLKDKLAKAKEVLDELLNIWI